MAKKPRTTKEEPLPRWYRSADVPMRVIRRFARQVAERFQPDKIILFGSYAYGTPHADSDVDILVIMPARNELDQAVRICLAVERNFPLDLIVRTPKNMKWRLEEGDSFLREITSKGKVLYENNDRNDRLRDRSLFCLRGWKDPNDPEEKLFLEELARMKAEDLERTLREHAEEDQRCSGSCSTPTT